MQNADDVVPYALDRPRLREVLVVQTDPIRSKTNKVSQKLQATNEQALASHFSREILEDAHHL